MFILRYFLNILHWLDIGLNMLVLLGSYNETVSERAARARKKGLRWGCVLCKVLDRVFSPVKRNHCDVAAKTRIGDGAIIRD